MSAAPDPGWDYASIWEKTQDIRAEVESLLGYLSFAEEATSQDDAEIEAYLKSIISKAYRVKNTIKAGQQNLSHLSPSSIILRGILEAGKAPTQTEDNNAVDL